MALAISALACCCLALVAPDRVSAAELSVPPLTGPVVDQAGILTSGDRDRLERLARAARAEENGEGVQIQFLTVSSLEGEPIESFSIRVAEAWKIRTRGKDNGLLFVVSMQEHAIRIEVGGGLEGGLTDVQSSRIIRSTIAPAFREHRYGDGLYDAATQALAALGALPKGMTPAAPPRDRPIVTGFTVGLLILILLFTFILRFIAGFGGRRRYWGGGGFGGWGGGGFGGGGFGGGWGGGGGGGGWSGGGGGFSGGGSSGSW